MSNPHITIKNDPEILLNNEFDIEFDFVNLSYPIGYKPFTDVLLPYGITLDGQTAIASWDIDNEIWKDLNDEEILEHPYDPDVPIPENPEGSYRWYYFKSVYSSYGPEQPSITLKKLTCNLSKSDGAIINQPLTIKAIPWFRYGNDAKSNPDEDPPIKGSIATSTITPKLLIIEKKNLLPESEVATGPNFPFWFKITVDVATGEQLDNITITDELTNTMKYIDSSLISSLATISQTITDSSIVIDYGSYTGIGGNDITIDYQVYIPFKDTDDNVVLNESTGTSRQISTTCYCDHMWDNNNLQSSDNDTFTAKSIAIQKHWSSNDSPVIPNSKVTYTHNIQVSDYFSFENINIVDILSDGQLFIDNMSVEFQSGISGVNTTYNRSNLTNQELTYHNVLNNDDKRTGVNIAINLSEIIANMLYSTPIYGGKSRPGFPIDDYNVGPTTFTITYDVNIDTYYDSIDDNVQHIDINDFVSNDVTINSTNYNFESVISYNNTVSDTSSQTVDIGSISINKYIYAVNGIVGDFTEIFAKDLVTYRVVSTLSHPNVQDMILNDYVPPPIMKSTDITNMNQLVSITYDPNVPPAVNTIQYGPTDTYHNFKIPVISVNSNDNSIRFNYGSYQTSDNISTQIIDIMYTLEASNKVVTDGLKLTNQAVIDINNTKNRPLQRLAYTQIVIREPWLVMKKSVVKSSTGSISPSISTPSFDIGAPGFSGSITSDTEDLDSNSSNNIVDGLLKYCIVIKNTGHADSYRTIINDIVDPSITPITDPYITDGAGNSWLLSNGSTSTDLFTNEGLNLGSISKYTDGPAETLPVCVITYDAQISSLADAGVGILNTATVLDYSNEENGINWSESTIVDTATVTMVKVDIDHIITSTTELHTSIDDNANNTAEHATIGEYVYFKSTITVPRGTCPNLLVKEQTNVKNTGTIDCGLLLDESSIVITSTANLQIEYPNPIPTEQNSGKYHGFYFGNVVNNSSSNTPETITIEYRQLVTDYSALVDSYVSSARPRVEYGNITTIRSNANKTDVTIKEPTVSVIKDFTNGTTSTPSKGTVINYIITIDSTNSSIDAKNFSLVDSFPPTLTPLTVSTNNLVGPPSLVNDLLTYSTDTFPKNTTGTITIECTVNEYTAGDRINNCASIDYDTVADTNLSRSYSKESWKHFETLPIINMNLTNETYDHGVIDSVITGAIGDTLYATIKMYIPKGQTYLKDIILSLGNTILTENSESLITASFGPDGHFISNALGSLETTPIINNNTVVFPFDTIVYNNRVSTDGDFVDYLQIVYPMKIKNIAENTKENRNYMSVSGNIKNTSEYIETVYGNEESYYIVEPSLTISASITQIPLDRSGDVEYNITVTSEDSTYTCDAFNITLLSDFTDDFSTICPLNIPVDFTDHTVLTIIDYRSAKVVKGESVSFTIKGTLDDIPLFQTITNIFNLTWTSQVDKLATIYRDGQKNNVYDDYLSIDITNTSVVPMIDIIPGNNQFFSVLFEDALDMDFDYEDLVLNGRYHIYRTTSGIVKIMIDYHLINRGAAFDHVFGIKIKDVNLQSGNWVVSTVINGETFENNDLDIKNYLNISDNNLSSLTNDRLPLFVKTKNYLTPDLIDDTFSANTNDRISGSTDWIYPSSVRCIISFDTPLIDHDIKILPYIDVFGYDPVTTVSDVEYTIILGDIVDFSRKGYDNYPRAIVVPDNLRIGIDYDYEFKKYYPEFHTWVQTMPDYSDIRSILTNPPPWLNVIDDNYELLKIYSHEYGSFSVEDIPMSKNFHNKTIVKYPTNMYYNNSIVQSGQSHAIFNDVNDAISIVTTDDENIYALKSNGTVVGTNNIADSLTNMKKIVSNSNFVAGITNDLSVVTTNNNSSVNSWTNIFDIAICGDIIVGLDRAHNILSTVGTINTSGWNNIIKICGSSSYLMGLDMDGKVYLSDMSNNQIDIWTGITMTNISCSASHCIGIDSDMQTHTYNIADLINWTEMIYVFAGINFSIGIKQSGMVVMDGTVPNSVTANDLYGCINMVSTSTSVLGIAIN